MSTTNKQILVLKKSIVDNEHKTQDLRLTYLNEANLDSNSFFKILYQITTYVLTYEGNESIWETAEIPQFY